jgi:threonine dehydratase
MDLSCEAHIIAGHGTIALEIMRQMRTRVDAGERTRGRTAHQRVDAIFVPVESGSLLAAIATCMSRISPTTKVIGVEPLPHGSPLPRQVTNETISRASFHGAPSCYGVESLRLCKAYVHDIVRVDAAQIADAIEHIYRQTRGVVEPAGALALAGASSWLSREASRALTSGDGGLTIIAITSGGNAELASLVSYLDIHQRNRPKEAEGGQVPEGWLRNDLARLGDDLASFGSATRGVLPLGGLLRANGRGVCVKHLRPQRLANICSLRLALPAASHSTPGRWGKEP